MSRLRGRVAERGVGMATAEQHLALVQQQCATDMQSVQAQLVSVQSRLDDLATTRSATSTALLDLYAH